MDPEDLGPVPEPLARPRDLHGVPDGKEPVRCGLLGDVVEVVEVVGSLHRIVSHGDEAEGCRPAVCAAEELTSSRHSLSSLSIFR